MALFHFDVGLGGGRFESIKVYKGDKAEDLAAAFCKNHGLGDKKQERIKHVILRQMIEHGILIATRKRKGLNTLFYAR
jgi:hypothetical protein